MNRSRRPLYAELILLALSAVLAAPLQVAAAAPAAAAGDQPEPLTSRRLFDQARPGVQLITIEYSANLSVPEPIVTAENERALEALAADRIQRGEIPATQAAANGAIAEEIAREPERWLTESSDVHRGNAKLSGAGSGFSITPDGFIVTSAHVVGGNEADVQAALLTQKIAEDGGDFLANVPVGQGLTPAQATEFGTAITQWAVRMTTFTNFKRTITVLGSSGSGSTSSLNRREAILISSGEEFPGNDVALIKVRARNMATLPLGDDTALATGERLFVLGFPGAATFNPAISKASQGEPTLTQGLLSAKKQVSGGYTVLQTDAGMTHGNSGGPVFDERGNVVGVATAVSVDPDTGREVSGLNFAVPASVVKDLVGMAHVTITEGEAQIAYRRALDAIDRKWYKRSLPLLNRVKTLDPGHPLVAKLIKDSQTAIRQGRDRTPLEILGQPVLVIAGAAGVVVVVLASLGTLALRSRRRGRRRGAPGPEPAVPPAGWGTQPEPVGLATQPGGPGATGYAEANRESQQSWWAVDTPGTVEVPTAASVHPAPATSAMRQSRSRRRKWRMAAATVVVAVLVATGLTAVLRPWSHRAAPAATTVPAPTVEVAAGTTGPPATTIPPSTRPSGPAGRVVAEVRVPDGLALNVPAIGDGSVWAMAWDTEISAMLDPQVSLARIDPASNRVTARIPVAGPGIGGVVAMAYGAGALWLVDSDEESHNVVSKVDPGRNRVVDRVTVGLQPVDVAFAAGSVWVLNSVDETVSRIDPDSGEVVATVRLPDNAVPPQSITATADAVWLPDADLGLVRIDPGTNRARIVSVPGCCSGPVTAAAGAIWAAESRSGTLMRFDPATRRIVRIPLDDVVDLVSAGDQVVAVGHTQVTWIDRSTNRIAGVVPVGQPAGIAGGDGMVWVADLESKSLKRVAAP